MSPTNRQIQGTQQHQETIIIDATPDIDVNTPKVRICWNTGEEKNCIACCLSKGCKAKA
jgi:hypothetical protein